MSGSCHRLHKDHCPARVRLNDYTKSRQQKPGRNFRSFALLPLGAIDRIVLRALRTIGLVASFMRESFSSQRLNDFASGYRNQNFACVAMMLLKKKMRPSNRGCKDRGEVDAKDKILT